MIKVEEHYKKLARIAPKKKSIEASSLLKKMNRFETALMTATWNSLLQRIYTTSESLQSLECEVSKGSELLRSLVAFNQSVREDFGRIVQEATKLSGLSFSTEEEPKQKRKRNSASNQGYTFSTEENFKINSFYMICDSIREQLKQRMEAYEAIVNPFRILAGIANK